MHTWNDEKSKKITEAKLLEGSQHHMHDMFYAGKWDVKYIKTKKLSPSLKNPVLIFLNFLSCWVLLSYKPISYFKWCEFIYGQHRWEGGQGERIAPGPQAPKGLITPNCFKVRGPHKVN